MTDIKTPHQIIAANISVHKMFIIFNIGAALVYLSWWFNFRNVGSPVLYTLLFIGELYHVWQALGYALTVWDQQKLKPPKYYNSQIPVDIYITVCGEPPEIVEKTIQAATNIDYPNFKIFILNDGYSRNLSGWQEINKLAEKYGAYYIIRKDNTGAKAGNVNNGLSKTQGQLVAIFDADHVPQKDFLKKTVPYFGDKKVALVQTPQYYANRDHGHLTTAAWEQQELFFGPICRGKNALNSTFWCGTNAVIRREALKTIGGVPENNIAEDFLASLLLHEQGWKTIYLPEILAEGLAPHDLHNYVLQQFRWARGSSELMFKYNALFRKNLTWAQRIQYLYSSSYYLNGFIVLIDALVPIFVLLTGSVPVNDQTSNFVVYFFPFIFSTINLLMLSTENTITFRAIQMSMSTSFVFIKAVVSAIFGIKTSFKVTSKEIEQGNHLKLAVPHIIYMVIGCISIIYAASTRGLVASVTTNASWVIFNSFMFMGFVRVAYSWSDLFTKSKTFLKEGLFSKVKEQMFAINPTSLIFHTTKQPVTVTRTEAEE